MDDEGSPAVSAAATPVGEKASASPVQLLSPAAPRHRLFQFQDGEEQGGIYFRFHYTCFLSKQAAHHPLEWFFMGFEGFGPSFSYGIDLA